MADSKTRRLRQMEMDWAKAEKDKRVAQRKVFTDARTKVWEKMNDYKRKAQGASIFLSACVDVLRICCIIGTVLNGARKCVMSGDYEIARGHFDKAFHYYILMGGQLVFLEKQLDKCEGITLPKEPKEPTA